MSTDGLTGTLARRMSEMYRQMIDMGMEPTDDCARIAGDFMEQVSYDLARMLPGFDRAAFLAVADDETPHPIGTCYGNPSADEPWVIYPDSRPMWAGVAPEDRPAR
jgi:hypothetical protein